MTITTSSNPQASQTGNILILDILNRFVPEVMMTMANMRVVPGEGQIVAPQPSKLTGISGSIGLSGRVHGVVYTAFTEELAGLVAEQILGGPSSEQDISDVVAELTNMITGNLKSQLCDLGYNCSLSIPSVVCGEHITVAAKSATISVRNNYQFDVCKAPLVLHVFAVFET